MTTYGGMPLALSLVALAPGRRPGGLHRRHSPGCRSGRAVPAVALRPAAAAALWTALEFLRAFCSPASRGPCWGTRNTANPDFGCSRRSRGVYGISAVLVLVNATLAETVGWLGRRAAGHGRPRDLMLAWGLAAVTLAGAWGYAPDGGATRRAARPSGWACCREHRPGGEVGSSATRRAPWTSTSGWRGRRRERPSLIVWPETAVPFFLRREPELGAQVGPWPWRRACRCWSGARTWVRTGSSTTARSSSPPTADSRDGTTSGTSSPSGSTCHSSVSSFSWTSWSPGSAISGGGERPRCLPTGVGRFSVMICYEVIFPAEVREFTRAGAQFLVNITNDAWFGRSGAPYQHLAMAAMRAVENGSYLVRAANTGVTAIIAPTGEILRQTPIFTEAALTGTIRLRQRHTPYARYGDVVAWGCLVFLVGYGLVLVGARRRGGPHGTAGVREAGCIPPSDGRPGQARKSAAARGGGGFDGQERRTWCATRRRGSWETGVSGLGRVQQPGAGDPRSPGRRRPSHPGRRRPRRETRRP